MTRGPQSVANHFGIGLYEDNVITILAFSFAGFMAEQVASVSAAALCLARSGDFKPLLHPFVSFLLRHGRNSLISITAMQVTKPTPPHSPDIGGEEYIRFATKFSSDFFNYRKTPPLSFWSQDGCHIPAPFH